MRTLLAALAAALLLAAPASAEIPAGNLVQNPGADVGEGAADSDALLPLPSWAVEATLTAVQYGAPQFPTPEDATRLGGGRNFFAGGPGGEVAAASQTVDVSRAAPEIDAGRVTATLSALIGGYSSQEDNATVSAFPLDATGASTGVTTIGPVTAAERASVTTLLPRSASFAVPAGTRSIRVTIVATRTAGSYNDGYADNVSLSLVGPPVAGQSVGAKVVSGTVLVRVGGRFVPLEPSLLRNGAEIDARKGVVEITRADGGVAKFYDGIFKLSQSGGITTLTLSETLACPRGAGAAQKKPKTRKLWGDGKGKFRTKGSYSAATVRGTKWLVQDTCTSTLTRVTQGSVTVRDTVLRRTVVVRAGKRYVARRSGDDLTLRARATARPSWWPRTRRTSSAGAGRTSREATPRSRRSRPAGSRLR